MDWIGMLICMLFFAVGLYVLYYNVNKDAKKEDWIVKDDLEEDKK